MWKYSAEWYTKTSRKQVLLKKQEKDEKRILKEEKKQTREKVNMLEARHKSVCYITSSKFLYVWIIS